MKLSRPILRSLLALSAFGLLGSVACSSADDDAPASATDVGQQTSGDATGGDIDDLTGEDGAGADAGAQQDVTVEGPFTAKLNLPASSFNYADPNLPNHFKTETLGFHGQVPLMNADTTPANNPTTDTGATLGRVLFYDKNLSKNRTVACASCHKAEFGFSDNAVLSKGFDGGDTGRHSMGLTQARFYGPKSFFWDQRAKSLEEQVLMPFQDPVEMGMTLDTLAARANAADYYPALFKAAFGDEQITTERISLALAQFVRSMVSTGSKYDLGRKKVSKRSDDFPNFTAEENLGKKLFVMPPPMGGKGCFVCHSGEGFIATEATSNGLDLTPSTTDVGVGGVTKQPSDSGTFKVPSLRNVALRAPYMHDGRFATLEAVIEHYSTGVQASPNLGVPFFANNGKVTQLNMTDLHKAALVAFLKTLTDVAMTQDPKFSDPFVK